MRLIAVCHKCKAPVDVQHGKSSVVISSCPKCNTDVELEWLDGDGISWTKYLTSKD